MELSKKNTGHLVTINIYCSTYTAYCQKISTCIFLSYFVLYLIIFKPFTIKRPVIYSLSSYWWTGEMHCERSVFVGNGCSKRSIIPFSGGLHYAGDVLLACSSRRVWNNANGTNSTLPLYCSECCGHFLLPCLRSALLSNCHTSNSLRRRIGDLQGGSGRRWAAN